MLTDILTSQTTVTIVSPIFNSDYFILSSFFISVVGIVFSHGIVDGISGVFVLVGLAPQDAKEDSIAKLRIVTNNIFIFWLI